MNSFSTYNAQRRLVQALSTALMIILPFLNILRLDIPTLRFYFFSSVLWVDEFYLLFLVVMLLLFVIVFFSMVYGRVWCGWMCPQIVLSEIAGWLEAKAKKLFGINRLGGTTAKKAGAWAILSAGIGVLSLVIAFNLVAYFVDPYRMIGEILHGTLSPITTGIMLGTAALLFADILFWREKFCTKACPYGMMQTVFTDKQTQIVRYQTERDAECIDCKACVRDCMMGIDIRTSPYQTECIHCGVCVDSCTAILSRLKKPLPTLITFTYGEHTPRTTWYHRLGFVDAKRWIIAVILILYTAVLVTVVHFRQPLSMSASGDRSTLYHRDGAGQIVNDYVVRVSNRSLADGNFLIQRADTGSTSGGCSLHFDQNPMPLSSREVKTLKMTITTSGANLHPGPNHFELEMVNVADPDIRTKTEVVFFMPERSLDR